MKRIHINHSNQFRLHILRYKVTNYSNGMMELRSANSNERKNSIFNFLMNSFIISFRRHKVLKITRK